LWHDQDLIGYDRLVVGDPVGRKEIVKADIVFLSDGPQIITTFNNDCLFPESIELVGTACVRTLANCLVDLFDEKLLLLI
jgi:hypothetical protein